MKLDSCLLIRKFAWCHSTEFVFFVTDWSIFSFGFDHQYIFPLF